MADVPIGNEGAMTGATPKTLLTAPAAATQRIIPSDGARVYNRDTVQHDVTFQKNKAATVWIIEKIVGVQPGGAATMSKRVVLDAIDESLEGLVDATATTTEPSFDVAAMETT